jgi:hypothetical protein
MTWKQVHQFVNSGGPPNSGGAFPYILSNNAAFRGGIVVLNLLFRLANLN